MSASLSVVIPVHNEAPHLQETVDALVEAVERSRFVTEVVLVDDGSTDGSVDVGRAALAGRLPLEVVSQPNRGRFEARRAGLEKAKGELALLLDGRVRIARDALGFVEPRIAAGDRVWTSHVHVLDGGSPFGAFWRLLAELAWSDYFDHPTTSSFGVAEFDRYPKGTTCFLAPRELLIAAMDAFDSAYADTRLANDDTPLLRWIAERGPIHVSPSYASDYVPRSELRRFVAHAYRRGIVFLDGHGRPESRFFPVAIGFFPLSAAWAAFALRRPMVVPLTAAAVGASAGALALSRGHSGSDAASLALASPIYAAAHGAGMWAGLGILAREFIRRRSGRRARPRPGDAR